MPNVAFAQAVSSFTFWDGSNTTANNAVDGGAGVWTTTGTNWTLSNGATNGAYDPAQLLIFAGTGGVVTVDSTAAPITVASGMQFATNGYTLSGGALQLTAPTNALAFGSTIRVGDGTAAGAAITANIATALTGPSGLLKTDLGTLRLTGANTYLGETRVLAGNLIQAGGTLGGTTAESALRVAIDPGSIASLAVTNGAVLTSTAASIATQTNSTGTVTVSGVGSRWNVVGGGGMRVGSFTLANTRGLVEILDGGVLNFSPALLSVAGGSTIRVSGAGSRLDAAATLLFNQGGGGSLTLENGGVARAENFEFGNTSALTIRSGARLETTSTASLTFGTGATMLVTGAGSRINSASAFSFNGNSVRGGDLIIEDNGIVASSANTDSGLGFDTGRNMIVRSGAQFNLTGGADAGLSMENSNLLVDNASVTMGGNFVLGQRFGNNTVTLLNANLTAKSISVDGLSVINVGGTRTGAAGAVGIFNAANVNLSRNDSGATAELNFNHTSNRYVISSIFGQRGRINLIAGNTVFTGDSAGFAGQTVVSGGSLIVNGALASGAFSRAFETTVAANATLGGTGSLGNVVVIGGTIAPGDNGVGTLTMTGNFTLDAASRLAFQLGAPNTPGVGSDLINVGGNLTLDGTLDVTNAGGFGAGLYRLINFGGTLTDNGLEIGAKPAGFAANAFTVQTAVARQVNLLVGAAAPVGSFTFWDGGNNTSNNVVDGGAGVWTTTGANWTLVNGATNGAYDPAQLLIFAGTGGAVTVDSATVPIAVRRGFQFASNGYRIAGGPLDFTNANDASGNIVAIRVGDGTAAGAAMTATIASNMTFAVSPLSTGGLRKTDLGTLILTGNSIIRRELAIEAGTLRIDGGAQITSVGAVVGGGTIAGLPVIRLAVNGAGTVFNIGGGALTTSTNGRGFNEQSAIDILNGGTLRDTRSVGHNMGLGTVVTVSGAGSLLDLSTRVTTLGDLVVERGGIARVVPMQFSGSNGSFIVREGGRVESAAGLEDWSFQGTRVLLQGQNTSFLSDRALSINIGTNFVVEDRATVSINLNRDSVLGNTGALATLDVRSGASFTLTGGINAGLQMRNSVFRVTDAMVAMGGGLSTGGSTGNNVISLKNTNFTAGSISLSNAVDKITVGGDVGEAAGGAGVFNVGSVALNPAGSTMVLNHTGTRFTIGSDFSGSGTIRHIAGGTRLTGNRNTWRGISLLSGGSLAVDGIFGDSAGLGTAMTVSGGAVLSGLGTVGGLVTVTDGIIRPGGDPLTSTGALLGGNAIGTLTFSGALSLGAASRMAFQLGAPGTPGVGSDLINVGGNLTLDGTLDVTNAGGFGSGLYRLINYGGTLIDNGLNIGLVPTDFTVSDLTIQTSVARQVNLLVGSPVRSFNFWDGGNTTSNAAVNGGAGIWTSVGTNWTIVNGANNGAYDRTQLLIFSGIGGAVTVENGTLPVTVGNGLQFAVDGYNISGGPLALTGLLTTMRVGDGTAAGGTISAAIGSVLSGASTLTKTDLGTLILTGANTYSGGTRIEAGTLRGNTTSLQGPIFLASAGTLRFDQTASGTYAGTLTGNGIVRSTGASGLTFSGNSSRFAGTTFVDNNTLNVTGNLGGRTNVAAAGTLIGNGTLGSLDVSGVISPGAGIATLTVAAGSLTQTVANSSASTLPATQTGDSSTPNLVLVNGSVAQSAPATTISVPAEGNSSYRQAALDRTFNVASSYSLDLEALRENDWGQFDAGTPFTSSASQFSLNSNSFVFSTMVEGRQEEVPLAILQPSADILLQPGANIIFRAGSTYAVDLAASGANDRINVAGTATLEGGTVAITTLDADLSYTDGLVFRILNATGGLTGTFAGLTESSAFLDFKLGYDPTGAFLTLAVVRQFPDVARTINQRAAASALSTLVRPTGSDGLAVYNSILLLGDNAARAAFDASSGEIYASLLATRQRQGAALGSRMASRGQANLREGLGIWGGVTAHDGKLDADKDLNAGQVSNNGNGGELGIDYRTAGNAWATGASGGWQDGDTSLPSRGSSTQNKTWHIGGYLRRGTGAEGFTIVGYGVHANADAKVTRNIVFGTIARTALAQTDVATTAIGVDMRYGWARDKWSYGPALSMGGAHSELSAFSENGAGALNLTGAGNKDTAARIGLGGFARYTVANGYVDMTAHLIPGDRVDARATLTMAGSPQAFTVLAPRGSQSGIRLGASGQYDLANNLSISGNLGFTQGARERDTYGDIRLSYRF